MVLPQFEKVEASMGSGSLKLFAVRMSPMHNPDNTASTHP